MKLIINKKAGNICVSSASSSASISISINDFENGNHIIKIEGTEVKVPFGTDLVRGVLRKTNKAFIKDDTKIDYTLSWKNVLDNKTYIESADQLVAMAHKLNYRYMVFNRILFYVDIEGNYSAIADIYQKGITKRSTKLDTCLIV